MKKIIKNETQNNNLDNKTKIQYDTKLNKTQFNYQETKIKLT